MDLDELFTDFIDRIRAGDDSAAAELVRTFEPVVRREIRFNMTDRRMVRLFDSVDICQSVWSSFFVRVAAGQFDIEGPKQLTGLLVAMAKTKLAFQARRNRFQKRDVGRVDPAHSAVETVCDQNQSSPSACASAKELLEQLQNSLTVEERQVSDFRRAGRTWQEVADSMGGTAQARRMQLDRAADRIVRQLGLDE